MRVGAARGDGDVGGSRLVCIPAASGLPRCHRTLAPSRGHDSLARPDMQRCQTHMAVLCIWQRCCARLPARPSPPQWLVRSKRGSSWHPLPISPPPAATHLRILRATPCAAHPPAHPACHLYCQPPPTCTSCTRRHQERSSSVRWENPERQCPRSTAPWQRTRERERRRVPPADARDCSIGASVAWRGRLGVDGGSPPVVGNHMMHRTGPPPGHW